ncbi:MAG: tricarballylate utilization 4Fe-4S protein TcuB [Beijerinckiaceae bacterium]
MSSINLLDLAESNLHDEARRAMEVCNACRYCEGYCAVFPAMEMRREFTDGDLDYLANLCHNCQGCYHSCQYAPPHPFGINVPKTFAELRLQTYADYAWPRPMARFFERNGTLVTMLTAVSVAFVIIAMMLIQDPSVVFAAHVGPGAFYKVIPWGVMTAFAGATFLFAMLSLVMSFRNFWRASQRPAADIVRPRSLAQALHDVFTLRYLGGGGHGCNDVSDHFSMRRRYFHHFTFYGFMLCFAATSVATVYDHVLGLQAPYPFFSLPVMLGTIGGIGLVIGPIGLIWIKIVSDPAPLSKKMIGGDYALLMLLLLISVTGLLLLALRETGAMGVLLAIHLGFVLAFFVAIPYSKMVHGLYRSAALIRYALERDDEAAHAKASSKPNVKAA